jgi:hypothetical protein
MLRIDGVMFRRRSTLALAVVTLVSAALVALLACSSSKDKAPAGMAEIASASLAVRAPLPPASVAPAAPAKPVLQRPKDSVDLIVSTEKRARVERLVPEAKGFLTSEELEGKLYQLELRRGKDADAVKALDRLAKGKWVLFTGNIGSITPAGCELPIRYTPKDPNDALGLTAVWLPIQITAIKGYDPAEYRAGELAAILARYNGDRKATPGYDVVLLKSWFPPGS